MAISEDKVAAYHQAVDQVWYAAERERLAVSSLQEIHPNASSHVSDLLEEIGRREEQALREVDVAFRGSPPSLERTAVEQELAAMQPALIAGPAEFLTGRGGVEFVANLHGLMAFEVMNAVDGQRTGLDIYRYVAAEAREAGAHYFGRVTADAVLRYLQSAAEAGLLTLR